MPDFDRDPKLLWLAEVAAAVKAMPNPYVRGGRDHKVFERARVQMLGRVGWRELVQVDRLDVARVRGAAS